MSSGKPILIIILSIVGAIFLIGALVCGIAGIFIYQGYSQGKQQVACENNLRQIALGMLNHQDQRGDLPPLYIVDEEGNKLHSWRVLLLPYMENANLWRQIRLNEPWNSEYNSQFHNQMPPYYQCPGSPHDAESGLTSYFSVEGENAPLQPCTVDASDDDMVRRYRSATSFSSLTKGVANQAMVYEAQGYAVNWMDPNDPTFEELQLSQSPEQPGAGSPHFGGLIHIAYADGRVIPFPKDGSVEELRRLLSRKPE